LDVPVRCRHHRRARLRARDLLRAGRAVRAVRLPHLDQAGQLPDHLHRLLAQGETTVIPTQDLKPPQQRQTLIPEPLAKWSQGRGHHLSHAITRKDSPMRLSKRARLILAATLGVAVAASAAGLALTSRPGSAAAAASPGSTPPRADLAAMQSALNSGSVSREAALLVPGF